jgi:hypothetical protein
MNKVSDNVSKEVTAWLNGLGLPSTEEEILKRENNTFIDRGLLENIDNVDISTMRRIRRKKKKECNISTASIPAILGDCITIFTSADKIPARYALVKIDDVIASHNEFSFEENPAYPKGCQERNYHSDMQLKVNVSNRSNTFEPLFLVNNVPTAEDGPPIISQEGIVLGGNSRVMMLKNIYNAKNKTKINDYYGECFEQLDIYGIPTDKFNNSDDLDGYVLVRIIDATKKKCAEYSHIFNTSTKNEFSIIAMAVGLSRQLNKNNVEELAGIIDRCGGDTLSEILKDKQQTTIKIISILQKSNIINNTNVNMFLKKKERNVLTSLGKEIVGNMLVALLFNSVEDIELIQDVPKLHSAILLNIGNLLVIRDLPNDWNIIPLIPDIAKKQNDLYAYGDMEDMFLTNKPLERTDIALWNILNLKSTLARTALENYIELAKFQNPEMERIIEITKITPADALEEALAEVLDQKEELNLSDKKMAKTKEKKPEKKAPNSKKKNVNIVNIDGYEVDKNELAKLNVVDDVRFFNKTLKQINAPFIAVCNPALKGKVTPKRAFSLFKTKMDGCDKVSLHNKVSEKKAAEWLTEQGYDFKQVFGVEPIIPPPKKMTQCAEKLAEKDAELWVMQEEIEQLKKEIKALKKKPKEQVLHVDNLNIRADEDIDVDVNRLNDRYRKPALHKSKSGIRRFWDMLP